MDVTEDWKRLQARFVAARRATESICEPLQLEDYVVQTCDDVSPIKWHLAHTSWFFETFLLKAFVPGYESTEPKYAELFNSYYNSVGPQFFRPNRGTLSRPTVDEIKQYRRMVTGHILELPRDILDQNHIEISNRLELGINHEQQHQELMLMDLKHIFGSNPLFPVYQDQTDWPQAKATNGKWHKFDGGLSEAGRKHEGFAFDNERPRHRVFLEPFGLFSELVTQGDFLNFIEDGGYKNHALWLSDGWEQVQEKSWSHPMYWHRNDASDWKVMTLSGLKELDLDAPVCHVSFFEADAYARWSGYRLPTEFEWEYVASHPDAANAPSGSLFEDGLFHPIGKASDKPDAIHHMQGEVWEWTSSSYCPYPGYEPNPGALGEYNGKFMNGQRVLRGGSCATSAEHLRRSYRNFFQPEKQWAFSGIRLAQGQLQ